MAILEALSASFIPTAKVPTLHPIRTVVLAFEPSGSRQPICVNDAIGLEPYASYYVDEYLDDLKVYDGITVVSRKKDTYLFSDGTRLRLIEWLVPISAAGLDALR